MVAVLAFARPPENFIDFAAPLELRELLGSCAEDRSGTRPVVLAGRTAGCFINRAELDDLASVGDGQASPAARSTPKRLAAFNRLLPQLLDDCHHRNLPGCRLPA
jgi:hypothetical protein